MATYVIGDVQGCYKTLRHLLNVIDFDEDVDTLWFAGDLVNRGPASSKVIRFVMGLGTSAVAVMGNHELNLLATAAELRKEKRLDTMSEVLEADDADELLEWVRHLPLAHFEEDVLMVHAGIHPLWSTKDTLAAAKGVEKRMQGERWHSIWSMSKKTPPKWDESLKGKERDAAALSVLVGVRMMDSEHRLITNFSGHPSDEAPIGARPWFKGRPKPLKHRVVFGHWAMLGLYDKNNVTCLDSGCVWGGSLSCLCLETDEITSVGMRDTV